MDVFSIHLGPVFLWFLAGIFFFLVEITHYGFVSFFFGVGAFIVAISTWFGLTNSFTVQIVFFVLTSVILLILLRKTLSATFKGKISGRLKSGQSLGEIKGEKATVISTIEPNKLDGCVEFHGTRWSAQAEEVITQGTVVEIVDRIDLTLKVKRCD